MALATDRLTAHFTYGELNAHVAPSIYLPALRDTAQYLEIVRSILGVPLQVTSGWRSPAKNEAVGGSDSSSHLVGQAADIKPLGRSIFSSYRALKAAAAVGQLPAWDQIIYYPWGHIHVGLGPQKRRQVLIRISEKHYAPLTPTLASTLPGASDHTLMVLAIMFVAVTIFVATVA